MEEKGQVTSGTTKLSCTGITIWVGAVAHASTKKTQGRHSNGTQPKFGMVAAPETRTQPLLTPTIKS